MSADRLMRLHLSHAERACPCVDPEDCTCGCWQHRDARLLVDQGRTATPFDLWQQATEEHGFSPRRAERYRELMIEHGHLVPGEPKPLPCGWSPPLTGGSTPQRDSAIADSTPYTPVENA